MKSTEPTTPLPRSPVSVLVADLITGTAPLKVALGLWMTHHGLNYERVSWLLNRKKGAVSAWVNRPDKMKPLGRDIAGLIGYEERHGSD